jgi:hypothetical protein
LVSVATDVALRSQVGRALADLEFDRYVAALRACVIGLSWRVIAISKQTAHRIFFLLLK